MDRIRGKFVVLTVLNVVQPVERTRLMTILKSDLSSREINSALRELLKEGRIMEESGRYRLTRRGLKTVPPGASRRVRDKARMHYLYDIWKNSRGGVS